MITPGNTAVSQEVRIPCTDACLYRHLTLPAGATGVVLFAHGSGSGRPVHSQQHKK